ncbi:hypothetical protein KSP40_PGU007538 [Platanthera guangdongensis]|uniref:Uncharacterized protein n=1 Tax=Platanthera guangdongensis TaxID=2320717 RepID=A0ABR2MGY4_9ASPA
MVYVVWVFEHTGRYSVNKVERLLCHLVSSFRLIIKHLRAHDYLCNSDFALCVLRRTICIPLQATFLGKFSFRFVIY